MPEISAMRRFCGFTLFLDVSNSQFCMSQMWQYLEIWQTQLLHSRQCLVQELWRRQRRNALVIYAPVYSGLRRLVDERLSVTIRVSWILCDTLNLFVAYHSLHHDRKHSHDWGNGGQYKKSWFSIYPGDRCNFGCGDCSLPSCR